MTTKSSFQLLRSAHHNSALRQSQDHLKACETFIGYTFTDIGLLSEALQAPGSMCLGANGQLLKRGNENLAIVGDAALTAILSAEWFRTDTNTQKGHWQQQWRDRLLSDKNLASVSRESGLVKFEQRIGMQADQVVPGEKRAASLFEAVAGAIYLDAEDGAGALKELVIHIGLLE